jgi:adenine deaminase
MRGFFHADDPAVTEDPRARWVPSAVRDAWREHARRARPESLAAGRAVLDRQMELVGAMHRAGVRLLAGTDTSAEPWVFAGSSLHDELGLLVEAGLTPVAALRAATVDARMYAGRGAPRLVAPGQPADLVLLDADPTEAIANTRRIHAVIRRGRFLGRPELDALLERARAAAAAPSPSPAPASPSASATSCPGRSTGP